jgi:hypothetical protein
MIFWKITTISNTQSHFQSLFSSYNTNYQKKKIEIHISSYKQIYFHISNIKLD